MVLLEGKRHFQVIGLGINSFKELDWVDKVRSKFL